MPSPPLTLRADVPRVPLGSRSGAGTRARARFRARLGTGLALLVLSACASIPTARPEPPKVSVAGVRPLNVSLTKQRLEFKLRVENPNPYDLPLRSLDFVANVAGEKIATGRSDERVTIPADGEAIVAVEVVTGIDRLIGRMRSMLDDRTLELDYDVAGSVKLANWPRRIPFDVEGMLENPRSGSEPGSGDEPESVTGASAR